MCVRDTSSGNAPGISRSVCVSSIHPVATSIGSPHTDRSGGGVPFSCGFALLSLMLLPPPEPRDPRELEVTVLSPPSPFGVCAGGDSGSVLGGASSAFGGGGVLPPP